MQFVAASRAHHSRKYEVNEILLRASLPKGGRIGRGEFPGSCAYQSSLCSSTSPQDDQNMFRKLNANPPQKPLEDSVTTNIYHQRKIN